MKKFLDVNGVKVILSIIDEKIQAIDIPDLDQFIKPEDLEEYITNEELEQVREQIEDMIPDLEDYAKTSYVDEKVAEALTDGKVDLTTYLTKEEASTSYQPKGDYITSIPEEYAKKSDIPSTENLVTKDELNQLEEKIPTDYLTENDLEGYAKKSDIPSTENLATKDELEEYAKKDELPKEYNDADIKASISSLETTKADKTEIPSLEGYAKQEELSDFITIESLENYVQEEELQAVEAKIPLIWKGSKSEYELIEPKDPNTLYLIEEE